GTHGFQLVVDIHPLQVGSRTDLRKTIRDELQPVDIARKLTNDLHLFRIVLARRFQVLDPGNDGRNRRPELVRRFFSHTDPYPILFRLPRRREYEVSQQDESGKQQDLYQWKPGQQGQYLRLAIIYKVVFINVKRRWSTLANLLDDTA